ncbi:MAG: prolyl oligopeptidase family serine peptidase [Phycisphaerales bacterium]|nr:MAG: prolyl oligopeptidase family serine peptidase [Phycisphaerales bacterium]
MRQLIRVPRLAAFALLIAALGTFPARGGDEVEATGTGGGDQTMTQALLLPRVGRYGRAPVHLDPVEAQIVAGAWMPPAEGDTVETAEGEERTWSPGEADENGWLSNRALRGGYAYWAVESDSERVMILEASGHRMVYVNGVPRGGDVYSTGWTRLPVQLKRGTNHFLFTSARGRLRAKLTEPKAPAFFSGIDHTMPDLIVGEDEPVVGAVIVLNATGRVINDLRITADSPDLPVQETTLPPIAPMTCRKVPFQFGGAVPPDTTECTLQLELSGLVASGRRPLDTMELKVAVRGIEDRQKRTFISDIDGSVQYYAVTPMHPPAGDEEPDQPALFLTLHGAGVEASGQAAAYSHQDWGHVVAATNRRPYGFDWEEWGRMDAVEVLELNQQRLKVDLDRTYLTGHSMGGHGTWQVGVTLPDRFAAIAPSAGWVSFRSYAGAPEFEKLTGIEQILNRAVRPSDTLALSRNFLHYGIYILHGEKDDNVPASEARTMVKHLADYHDDFAFYLRPGAGHWWGNRCVDWPPLFEFLARHERPAIESVNHVEFVTANPAISAHARWLSIEAQVEHGEISSVVADLDRESRRFSIRTENVARLSLQMNHLPPDEPMVVVIDEQELAPIDWPAGDEVIWLARDAAGEWKSLDGRPSSALKGPHRYGPFKNAFRNRMVFVYGTNGTDEENRWSYGKARYDAETFWYRGNGAVDVVADVDFDADRDKDRAVILYGNADTNGAWNALLGDSPVQVRRGEITIGDRALAGDDLACLFLQPRPDSDVASVGVVTGSGVAGLRLTDRLPYFVSGVGYPDCIVLGPDVLSKGREGIRAAGYFGQDWSVESGDFAWRD